MTRTALSVLLSHWRRQPVQLATLLLGLALATALWSAVQAVNAEAKASYDTAASALSPGALDSLTHPSGAIPLATYVALRRTGWQVSPVLEGRVETAAGRVTILGVDLLTAPVGSVPAPADPEDPVAPQDLLSGPGLGLAAPETVDRFQGADPLPPLRAATGAPSGRIVMDIATAARLLDSGTEVTRLLVLPVQPMGVPPLSEVAPDLVRGAVAADTGDIARLTSSFHLNLTAFGLLSFAVGLFIVHGAIGLAFEQRRTTFRTLRALGVPARHLSWLLLAELMVLALVAGVVGVGLGYVLAGLLLPDVAATLRGLYGADVPGALTFRPMWALAALAIALGGTAVAGVQAMLRLRRLPLLASARPRAWALASLGAMRWQAIAGALLIACGIAAPIVGNGLWAGFALLGGLLLGAALLLPLVLAVLVGLAERASRGPLGQWFWADTRQQLPGLSLALMALLLALSTNIGVSTMVGSFRYTFTGWLDQRLSAELYLNTRSDAEAAEVMAWLATRADAVLPVVAVETRLGGAPGQVYGVLDDATYRDNWPLLASVPDVWARVAMGETVLINEQLARRSGYGLGDQIAVSPDWTLTVGAIYSDYGNPSGQAIVGLDALEAQFGPQPRRRFGVRTQDGAGLSQGLMDEVGLPASGIVDQDSLKALSLSVFERTFTVTGALNALTLGVAGVAILTALMTLAGLRLPQLAPVWALGTTRARLGQLEAIRSVALAALTFVLALPTGILLAWALLAVVNVEAFGWKLPLRLFPMEWLWLLALALVAALAAALWPAIRLARTPPAQFLKVFADDR